MKWITILFFSIFIIPLIYSQDEKDNKNNINNIIISQKINANFIKLKEDNHVLIKGHIDVESASKFVYDILKLKKDKIYIYLDTGGGSVIDGNNIIQLINTISTSGTDIICIADYAASMGFAIFQLCPRRYILSNSVLMQHQMSLSIKGALKQVNNKMNFLNILERKLMKEQSKRLGLTIEEFDEKTAHDWWLYGIDALENSAADGLVSVICDSSLVDKTFNKTVDTLFGSVKVEYYKCPLIKAHKEIHQ